MQINYQIVNGETRFAIERPGRPTYYAMDYHTADTFAQRVGVAGVPLEAEADTTRTERLNRTIAHLLTPEPDPVGQVVEVFEGVRRSVLFNG